MREIRFRVYDEKKKKWVHSPGNEVNLFGEFILLGAFMHGVKLEELNDCVALQFTGMTDKNGKEIYEGDIIKRVGYGDEIGEVSFEAPTFYMERRGKDLEYIEWPDQFFRDCEVIGNKYDNPVLLQKEMKYDEEN